MRNASLKILKIQNISVIAIDYLFDYFRNLKTIPFSNTTAITANIVLSKYHLAILSSTFNLPDIV